MKLCKEVDSDPTTKRSNFDGGDCLSIRTDAVFLNEDRSPNHDFLRISGHNFWTAGARRDLNYYICRTTTAD